MSTPSHEARDLDLRTFPLFADLAPEDEQALVAACRRRRYRAGEDVFAEGDPAEGFYMVLEGCVKIYKVGTTGAEQVLALVGPGESFAEAALFQPSGYPASASAVQASDLLYLDREALLDHLRRHPEVALRMVAGLSKKLKRLVRLVEDLSLRDARGRLCRYLLTHVPPGSPEPVTVRLPVRHGVLARLLGLANETFSRTLRGLRDDGILETLGRDRIRVKSLQALREAAGEEA